ncbi:ABC transporter substrate-binding protein [Chitinasiproducens palmae]|uniref:ABC-type nitrate/sulfonate/bicarbonate transport system, substrate-binding protein n=1 Tax=Chitinasiproducens palmae TaxID=1770053 RepID=A0A1H2PQ65_9BURK|nr:ABC transporter substrate-binding protein [Chitinasiproducens palmae]SDV48962.1 ABC-type nitrate/sulfonate/bicarbonate transport system, substrate-binding protein [Chitinasiproducens palmae]
MSAALALPAALLRLRASLARRRGRALRTLALALPLAMSGVAHAVETVNYGYIAPVAYYWDVFAAKALGFDREAGVDIRPMRIDSASQSVQTLLAGAVDILSTPAELAISAREKGADVTMIGAETARPSFTLVARPEIKNYADLRGKIIGVTQINEAVSTMIGLLLERHGLRRGDYQLLALGGGPTRYAALLRGAVAATALSQPQDFKAVGAGMHALGSTADVFESPYIVFATRGAWANQHRPATVGFLRAVARASRWLRDPNNRERALSILQQAIQASPEDASKTYALYLGKTPLLAPDLRLGTRDVTRYLTLRGSQAAPEPFVSPAFLDEALAGLPAAP